VSWNVKSVGADLYGWRTMARSTLTQLAILVAFVLPGSVYQAVRARLAGEVPANRDLSNRVLRALAASVVRDGLYGMLAGPPLVRVVGGHPQSAEHARHWIVDHVRVASLLGLLLLFVIPTGCAYFAARRYAVGDWFARYREHGLLSTTWGPGSSRLRRLVNRGLAWLATRCEMHGGLRYDPTPTAWDWAVDHGGTGDGFVRVLGKDGKWHGGLYRPGSFFNTFPEPPRGVRRASVATRPGWRVHRRAGRVARRVDSLR
jgi:hypothetical protein